MATQKQLREIERAFDFRYPHSTFEQLSSLIGTESFRRAFPNARLLFSASEIATVREGIPTALLPFMCEEQPSWPDIYAFDLDSTSPEFRVVVWSDHAVVMDWESFPVFIQWVRDHIARHDTAA